VGWRRSQQLNLNPVGNFNMNHRPSLFLTLTTLCLIAGAVSAQDAESSRGEQLLSPYKARLQDALRAGLSEGVVEAIAACRIQAPKIAESLSQDGIRVGRASHRLRNPANVPPSWVEPILESYVANASDREPRSVSLSASRIGYAEPIVLQPVCATCHGETIVEEVAVKINELYPEDRAVGFRVGELRGVFWVEYPDTVDTH
jgi:hypothetical protein